MKPDLRLEGVLSDGHEPSGGEHKDNRTDQRHKGNTLITDNVILITGSEQCCCVAQVERHRVNVNTELTVDGSSKGVAGVVNVQVRVQRRGVIQDSSHGQSGSNVCGTQNHVALSSESVGWIAFVTLDLEQKSFELLNRPTTIGVNVQVEHTSSCGVGDNTLFSNLIDGSDDFPVDFSQDFSGQDVGQFGSAFILWMI